MTLATLALIAGALASPVSVSFTFDNAAGRSLERVRLSPPDAGDFTTSIDCSGTSTIPVGSGTTCSVPQGTWDLRATDAAGNTTMFVGGITFVAGGRFTFTD